MYNDYVIPAKAGISSRVWLKISAFAGMTSMLLFSNICNAGGWVQDSGKGLFVQNASYYSASKYFDKDGRKRSQSQYQKYELNPYFEYGFSDKLTLGANIFLSRTSQYDTFAVRNRTNYGVGDTEIFARTLIWKGNGFSFSAEPMIKLPSLDKRSDYPQIGSRHVDAGIGFSGGYGYRAWGLDHFVNLDLGYRHRFGTPNDQVKFAATAGFSATKKIGITAQLFNITSLANPSSPAFTQSSSDDYDLTKIQLSTSYKFDNQMSVGLGVFTDVDGTNVGKGAGSVLSFNKEF